MAISRDAGSNGISPRNAYWAVIPAGGSGTRLWPLSRSTRPKFLLPLLGSESLLQQTFSRLTRLTDPNRIIVVCGPAHVAAIARQLPDLPAGNIIVEPAPNGTGPALALATALIHRLDPGATVGCFAADHDVADVEPSRGRRALPSTRRPGAIWSRSASPYQAGNRLWIHRTH